MPIPQPYDEGPQQRKEAHGSAYCCTRVRNHQPPLRPKPHPSQSHIHAKSTLCFKQGMQVLVDAIVNTGPREDSTRIGSQGTVRRQAVDVSPLRRVNQAISLLTTGVRIHSVWHK